MPVCMFFDGILVLYVRADFVLKVLVLKSNVSIENVFTEFIL